MKTFNVEKATRDTVEWIRNWFEENGKDCNAVVGISGGKDSSVVAALLVRALGNNRVIGVLMPNGEQFDISFSHMLCDHLNIKKYVFNIKDCYKGFLSAVPDGFELSDQSVVNLSPRIRMTALYLLSQSLNGRVANTCNLSEDYVGYSTRYGDSVGDFSPCSDFTVEEVKAIGRYLGLPKELVDKPPIDGLCGKTDEDNLGFSYDTLDKYIRHNVEPDPATKARIDRLHKINLFKLKLMPKFEVDPDKYYQ